MKLRLYYFGEFVEDGERTDITQLKELIEEGATDIELADTACKAYARHLQFVDRHTGKPCLIKSMAKLDGLI